MGGRRRCCCGCLKYYDDFQRTTLGPWTAIDGDWSVDGELVEVGTNPSMIRCDKEIPLTRGSRPSSPMGYYMSVSASFVNEQVGDTFCLYGRYADEDNYIVGKYKRESYDTATIVLFKRVGGVDELLSTLTFPVLDPDVTYRTISLCLADTVTVFWAGDSSFCYVYHDYVPITDGNKSGVGHENNHETVFKDFSLLQMFEPDGTVCFLCWACTCGIIILPATLYATYEGDTDTDCDTLDGITVKLDLIQCGANICRWRGTINDGCLAGSDAEMELLVTGPNPENWELTITPARVDYWPFYKNVCFSGPAVIYASPNPSCAPLDVVFSVYDESISDPLCPEPCRPCGNPGGADNPKPMRYWIHITE